MTPLAPPLRRAVLAGHLTASVGWIGSVIAYVTLDVTVATSVNADVVRGAWIAMGVIASVAMVPLALASLLTGLVISLGTRWGLFRHWWVVVSLALTVFATVVLVVETGVIGRAADRAADPTTSSAEVLALPTTLPHSVGGLLVLLVIQVLNIYKPSGLTRYGWRKQQEERAAARREGAAGARSAAHPARPHPPRC